MTETRDWTKFRYEIQEEVSPGVWNTVEMGTYGRTELDEGEMPKCEGCGEDAEWYNSPSPLLPAGYSGLCWCTECVEDSEKMDSEGFDGRRTRLVHGRLPEKGLLLSEVRPWTFENGSALDARFEETVEVDLPGSETKTVEVWRILETEDVDGWDSDLFEFVSHEGLSEDLLDRVDLSRDDRIEFLVVSTLPNSMPLTAGAEILDLYREAFAK